MYKLSKEVELLNFKSCFKYGVESVTKDYDRGILEGLVVDKEHIKKKNQVVYTVHLPAIGKSFSRYSHHDELQKLDNIEEFENELFKYFGEYVMKELIEEGGTNG